jgi:hypothetical protein
MDALIQDILSDLAIIASVSPNDTISTSGSMQVISHEGSGLSRLWRGESRQNTISIIEKKIVYAFEYSALIMESIYLHSLSKLDMLQVDIFNKRMSTLQRIQSSLDAAKNGIMRLIQTYKDDMSTTGRLNTIIGNINFQTNVIRTQMKKIWKYQMIKHFLYHYSQKLV